MNWFWTWSGKSFGYRNGDNLFTASGHHVGYFDGDEIYACSDGLYLGEVKNNRLITNLQKSNRRKSSRATIAGSSYVDHVDYVGNVMYAGYEDFPEFE